jgi:hypothetical protein
MQFITMIFSCYTLADIRKMFFVIRTGWLMIIIVYLVRDPLQFETRRVNELLLYWIEFRGCRSGNILTFNLTFYSDWERFSCRIQPVKDFTVYKATPAEILLICNQT